MRRTDNRLKILLAAEIVCLLLLLALSFKRSEQMITIYDTDMSHVLNDNDTGEFESTSFVLKPGVYDIELFCEADAPADSGFQIVAKTDKHFAFLGNMIPIVNDKECVTFSVWSLDKNEVYAKSVSSAHDNPILYAKVFKTSKGYSALMIILLGVFALADLLIIFRKKIIKGEIPVKKQIIFWVMLSGIMLSFFPLLAGYCYTGEEGLFAIARIQDLAETLKGGNVSPIYFESLWNNDPMFDTCLVFQDLFLYIPAILTVMGLPFYMAYKLFIFAIIASGCIISYACFKRCVKDEIAGLTGSMTLLLMPYHLLDIYNRAAIGECLSFVFLPLIFCGMYLLYSEEKKNKAELYLIIGMTGLINSSLIIAMAAAFTVLIFAFILYKKTFVNKRYQILLKSAIFTLLINAVSIIPGIFMIKESGAFGLHNISLDISGKGVSISDIINLLPSSDKPGIAAIGAGFIMILIIYAIWTRKSETGKYVKECRVSLIAMLVFLILSLKYLPWDQLMKLPVLGRVIVSMKTPKIFMLPALLFASVLVTFFFADVYKKAGKIMNAGLTFSAAAFVISAVYQVNSIAFENRPVFLYDAANAGAMYVKNHVFHLDTTVSIMAITVSLIGILSLVLINVFYREKKDV